MLKTKIRFHTACSEQQSYFAASSKNTSRTKTRRSCTGQVGIGAAEQKDIPAR